MTFVLGKYNIDDFSIKLLYKKLIVDVISITEKVDR